VLRDIAPGLDEITSVTVIGLAFGGLRAAITYCRAQGHGPERTREAAEQALAIVERVLESLPGITG
jgi:hypothetical protein